MSLPFLLIFTITPISRRAIVMDACRIGAILNNAGLIFGTVQFRGAKNL